MSLNYDYSAPLIDCPLDRDPLALASQAVFESCTDQLPNLAHITFLVPSSAHIPILRKQLMQHAKAYHCRALLGPDISTLKTWLNKFSTAGKKVISAEFGLALLVSEIKKFKWLYGNNNPWYFAEDLLHLFNDLSNSRIQLPEEKDHFFKFLSEAYGAPSDNQKTFLKEADLIFTLWQAWQQQLHALNLSDQASLHAKQLHESLKQLSKEDKIYLVAHNQLLPIEDEWISKLLDREQIKIIRYGYSSQNHHSASLGLVDCVNPNATDNLVCQYYHQCFNHPFEPVYQRINQFKTHSAQLIPERLKLLACDSAEKHALSIYLSVKQALLKQHQKIGIITEDRRIARRVRALLERENLVLNDISGWALSTTHASTVIDNWLQCLEEDFPYLPFLDLLKSRFINPFEDRKLYLELIYRFEQDIILHENISTGIDRYINALERRAHDPDLWTHKNHQRLLSFLKDIRFIAKKFNRSTLNTEKPLADIISSVKESIKALCLDAQLEKDSAGKLILKLIDDVLASSEAITGNFCWLDFRIWYGRLLESHYFSPPSNTSDINILSLEQSYLLEFDTLILAAADINHFPGKRISHAFFNDRVRLALSLSHWKDKMEYQAFLFRAMLERNSNIIISWQSQNNGEPISASPWVVAIENFHLGCFKVSLLDKDTETLVNDYFKHHSLPQENSRPFLNGQPRPSSIPIALSKGISVSAHQRIINCPYQFYASDLLKLKASDEIRETLQKSDFGNRIHLCLHAFFSKEKELPGPFDFPITENNRAQAIALLSEISKKVFSKDIEDNFQHRSWLSRWLNAIPNFIESEIKRQQNWRNQATEQSAEQTVNNIKLYGRIDRIDTHITDKSFSLIDYKTGIAPNTSKIEDGEDVQLSSYALMLSDVARIEYLQFDNNGALKSSVSENEALSQLTQKLLQRTEEIFNMIEHGHELPAWPDKDSCAYCDFIGLCRYPNWQRTVQKPTDVQ